MTHNQSKSLAGYNTFGIEARAAHFYEVDSLGQLDELSSIGGRKYILGGGSNILIWEDLAGPVIRNCLLGHKILHQDADHVYLEVASGEPWHDTVMMAVKNGWGGMENLALIPGTVGAAPIQNIGAYGAEVRNIITEVRYWNWDQRCIVTLTNADCHFGYRDSVFKHGLRDKCFVTAVVFRLSLRPAINIQYGAIAEELKAMGIGEPGIADVAEAVIRIRSSKLPDPKKTGNAGSFFKNPEMDGETYRALSSQFPGIPSYDAGTDRAGWKKVPAAWLIEQCGWKGYRDGAVGVHEKQALVIVNYGGGTGKDIMNLADKIVDSVKCRFGICLEKEVQLWTN